jgi:gliding motility-associated protein GldE
MFLLLLLVALVSAAEAAFFSFGPAELEVLRSSQGKSDERILTLIQGPKRLLATLLISVNFLNIAIVILSTNIMDGLFEFPEGSILEIVINVVAVTFLILMVGEVIPKIYATQSPVRTARGLVLFVSFLQKLFYPVSSFLVFSTSITDTLIKPKSHNISVDELSQALELTADDDLPEEDHKILQGIVKFGNTDVKQIMTSRVDVTAFEHESGFTQLLADINTHGFSRVPVYRDSLDHITGILYTKDLLQYIDKPDTFNWQATLRPPFFVPENKKIDDLLREFQQKKIHMAIVVDEYGGTAGIVTLEDVIEEIVGEINDEFDDDDLNYSKLDDHNFVFEGKAPLNDVFRVLELDADDFEDARGKADSLGGLITEIEERIPAKGEQIRFRNLVFTIESADNRKLKRIKVTIDESESTDDED